MNLMDMFNEPNTFFNKDVPIDERDNAFVAPWVDGQNMRQLSRGAMAQLESAPYDELAWEQFLNGVKYLVPERYEMFSDIPYMMRPGVINSYRRHQDNYRRNQIKRDSKKEMPKGQFIPNTPIMGPF